MHNVWKMGLWFVLLGLMMPAIALAQTPDLSVLFGSLGDSARDMLIRFGGGFGILLGGWLVARILSWLTFRALQRTTLDDRIAEALGLKIILDTEKDQDRLERILARGVFYLLMMFVLIAALKQAGLSEAAMPIERFLSTIAESLPLVGKAALILVASGVAALAARQLVVRALQTGGLNQRFAELSEGGAAASEALSHNAGQAVFWLILIAGLAGAFDALQITPIAVPMRNAMDQVITHLPSVALGALLVAAGWVFGRIARTIVQNLATSLGLDALVERSGLSAIFSSYKPSVVLGLAVHGFILLQASIASLNQVGLQTLSGPLTAMMERFWLLLPDLAVGALLLVVSVTLGRVARQIVTSALKNLGFDKQLERLGFGRLMTWHPSLDEPSELAGLFVQAGIVLAATAQVLDNLELTTWAAYVNGLLAYAVQNVLVSLVILLVGFALSGVVRDLIAARAADSEADREAQRWMGGIARYAVLVFTFTMAIRHLDVAEDFVLLSFGLMFGALCLAMALAFGLGSRDVAADIVRRQYERAQKQHAPDEATPPSVSLIEGEKRP